MLLCVPSWWVSPGLLCTCWPVLSWGLQGDPQQDHRALSPSNPLPSCSSSSPGRCPAVPASLSSQVSTASPHLQENPRLGLGRPSLQCDLGTFSRQHVKATIGLISYFCFSRITVLCLPAVQYLNITIFFLSSFVCLLLMRGGKSSPDG